MMTQYVYMLFCRTYMTILCWAVGVQLGGSQRPPHFCAHEEAPPIVAKDELIVPLNQGRIMWAASTLSLVAGARCYQLGHRMLSTSPIVTCFASINYWRKPVYGARRNMDMCCVLSSWVLHSMISLRTEHVEGKKYLWLTPVAFGLYGTSWLLYKKSWVQTSSLVHALVHVAVYTMNVALYKRITWISI